jgi:DNA-binding CsgD family transcriptional regulator
VSSVVVRSAKWRLVAAPKRPTAISFDFEDLQACIRWGLLVVNETGMIVFATRRARVFLAAECGIGEKSGRLYLERSYADRSLQELIRLNAARSTEMAARRYPQNVLGVPDREGRTHYLVKVFPFGAAKDNSLALIAVSDLVESPPIDRSIIAAVFHFSAREAELGELFSNGLRIEEIAPRMGVAMNTARVHLRNVLAKTGCASQIELARTFGRFF